MAQDRTNGISDGDYTPGDVAVHICGVADFDLFQFRQRSPTFDDRGVGFLPHWRRPRRRRVVWRLVSLGEHRR